MQGPPVPPGQGATGSSLRVSPGGAGPAPGCCGAASPGTGVEVPKSPIPIIPGDVCLRGNVTWSASCFPGEGEIKRRGGSCCHDVFQCWVSTSLGTP